MSEKPQPQRVEITGINIPFGEWVALMVKVALAAIPAALIFAVIVAVFWAVIAAAIR